MRTTLDLDEDLLKEASRLTGIGGKTALIHRALLELIRRESAKMLAALGGTAPNLRPGRRRRGASGSLRANR
jgi:Arc/MetJ family transcription regulator